MNRPTRTLLVAVLALVSLPAAAQNILVNPRFDGNATGWNLSAPAAYDGTKDAGGGAVGSGSVTDTYTGTATATADITQCVAGIVPGSTYGFGFSAFVTGPTAPSAYTRVSVQFYASTDCTGPFLPGTLSTNYATPPADTWSLQAGSGPAPATSASAAILLWIGTNTGPVTVTMNYDNAFLGIGLTSATLTRFRAE